MSIGSDIRCPHGYFDRADCRDCRLIADSPSRDSHPVGGEEDEYSSQFWQRMTEEERDDTLISMAMCGGGLNSDVGEDVERKLRKRLALLRSLRSSLATVSKDLADAQKRIRLLDNVIVEHHSASVMRDEHHVCPVCTEHGGVQFFLDNARYYRRAPRPEETGETTEDASYGVRECRGHWHVTAPGGMDIIIPGDPFNTEADAREAARRYGVWKTDLRGSVGTLDEWHASIERYVAEHQTSTSQSSVHNESAQDAGAVVTDRAHDVE